MWEIQFEPWGTMCPTIRLYNHRGNTEALLSMPHGKAEHSEQGQMKSLHVSPKVPDVCRDLTSSTPLTSCSLLGSAPLPAQAGQRHCVSSPPPLCTTLINTLSYFVQPVVAEWPCALHTESGPENGKVNDPLPCWSLYPAEGEQTVSRRWTMVKKMPVLQPYREPRTRCLNNTDNTQRGRQAWTPTARVSVHSLQSLPGLGRLPARNKSPRSCRSGSQPGAGAPWRVGVATGRGTRRTLGAGPRLRGAPVMAAP